MQDMLSCYLNLVYLNSEWIVGIPSLLKVDEFIALLLSQFECEIEGEYLYEMKSNRLLDNDLSFQENFVQSGDYLYFL